MIPLHPQPLRDFDYIGFYYYFLTWCCDYRQPLFTQPDHVSLVREQFLRAEKETGFANVAYCFMPDHVHKVMKACGPNSDALRYIKLAKQYSGYYYSKAYKGRIWQRYGYDRVARRDDEPRIWVRYTIENPVRRGLVANVEDYPFTGSSLYSMKELKEMAYAI